MSTATSDRLRTGDGPQDPRPDGPPSDRQPPTGHPPLSEGVPDRVPSPVRRFRWGRLGIQSKLLIMLCATAILSTLVIGFVGYRIGTDALRDAAYERLVSVRNLRAAEITREFDTLRDNMAVYTRGSTAFEAATGFTEGFADLQDIPVTDQEREAVTRYYDTVFLPALNEDLGSDASAEQFLPTSNAQWHLQAAYTAPSASADEAIKLDDAGDGSAWSATHARFQDYFRTLTTDFGYGDAMIVDLDGTVVYTARSGVDLGTDLESGPYRNSDLAEVYRDAVQSNDFNYVGLTDLDRYQPANGVPTGWMVSPIGQGGRIVGVLALQLPLDRINRVMTGDGRWAADGFGDTGETYLVGPDHLMRSASRAVLQDPEGYRHAAVQAGTPTDVADRAVRVGGTALLQAVDSPAVQAALQGQSGTTVERNYLGRESLAAYAPLQIGGLQWVIVAEVAADEVFAPVTDLTRAIVLATLAIVFVVCLASMALAQAFSRPVRRLAAGVRHVAEGHLGTQVDGRFSGEFSDLANAFNDMSRSLQVKQDLLDEQLAENDRLLLAIMPETVAERYRQGEDLIAEDHQDVSVLFAEVVGFDELSRGTGNSTEGLAMLSDLVRSFDDAAARLGIEKIRTTHTGYLASCGLTVPRIDHARRIVDFALEMQRTVERFTRTHGAALRLRAGIDTGTVSSGLLSRTNLVYDLWGDAVTLAHRVSDAGGARGIFLTDEAARRLPKTYLLEPTGELGTATGSQQIWSVRGGES